MTKSDGDQDQRCVNVIKGLVMDAVRKANSGHPGGPMSSADFAYILYKEFLRFDPDDAEWFNRDRFVLSAGHESMLLYSLLTFCGFLSLDDLRNFRQLHSKTPGHPEVDMAPGVEATTGPLGQGFAMSGGLAAAEAHLRARLGADAVDHYTYVIASDGDLQEPIALGSASLFGQWGLGKLIVFYDSNSIQLAGPTSRADCTDYKKTFEGFCWQVIEIDGHDHDQIRKAIKDAQQETTKPTLIIGKTIIAKGTATMEGDFNTHGAPLSEEEIAATKTKLGLPADEFFFLPSDALDHFRSRFQTLRSQVAQWKDTIKEKLGDSSFKTWWEFCNCDRSALSLNWPEFEAGSSVATRKAWGMCLNHLIDQLPILVGGSADLDPSNQTVHFRETTGVFGKDNYLGRNFSFGVREFPMGAVCNGLALHKGVTPFGATFLVFSDYERNAIRMSAIQKLPVLHVFTHDSFWVGEDGPTHQPIEHVSSLRLIPNLLVFRPADAIESKYALETALKQTETPSVLLFTRQGLPVMDEAAMPQIQEGVAKGGYIVKDAANNDPEMIIMATGSEVSLALEAAEMIKDTSIRVVSIPCLELFEQQPDQYKEQVLPSTVRKRIAIEAGRSDLWYKYTGRCGLVIGLDHFGDSAPGKVLAEEYGFTPAKVAESILHHSFTH